MNTRCDQEAVLNCTSHVMPLEGKIPQNVNLVFGGVVVEDFLTDSTAAADVLGACPKIQGSGAP
ncbi:MAG: hypothetical protein C7B45_15760 [Sulfobacillus acidophilus]|uniref:Uncharacterized protein n=1 Tax=Sulfobacillus acidophilus TaxID=53633 RepID=A0A2T2WDD9_9FIRM|nr:MAG: hypothetical protein C7B45_15760 [Sulfobacillus acidophilus]